MGERNDFPKAKSHCCYQNKRGNHADGKKSKCPTPSTPLDGPISVPSIICE